MYILFGSCLLTFLDSQRARVFCPYSCGIFQISTKELGWLHQTCFQDIVSCQFFYRLFPNHQFWHHENLVTRLSLQFSVPISICRGCPTIPGTIEKSRNSLPLWTPQDRYFWDFFLQNEDRKLLEIYQSKKGDVTRVIMYIWYMYEIVCFMLVSIALLLCIHKNSDAKIRKLEMNDGWNVTNHMHEASKLLQKLARSRPSTLTQAFRSFHLTPGFLRVQMPLRTPWDIFELVRGSNVLFSEPPF